MARGVYTIFGGVPKSGSHVNRHQVFEFSVARIYNSTTTTAIPASTTGPRATQVHAHSSPKTVLYAASCPYLQPPQPFSSAPRQPTVKFSRVFSSVLSRSSSRSTSSAGSRLAGTFSRPKKLLQRSVMCCVPVTGAVLVEL